jgi:hypothetical protein
MDKLSPKHLALAKEAAAQLNVVAKSLPLLRSMAWEDDIREKFLRDGALPAPDYPRVETNGAREAIAQARAKLDGDHVVTQWLSRLADTLTSTVSLLETRGTAEFYTPFQSVVWRADQADD